MVSLKKQDPKTRVAIFTIDTDSETDKLPTSKHSGKDNLSTVHDCTMGSIAEVITDSSYVYILNGQDQWVKRKHSSGGGGVDPGDYDWATEGDIDNLFP